MTLPSLVSFSGYRGVGRDTAADQLVAKARFVKCTIDEPLEEALLAIDPLILDPSGNSVERYSTLKNTLGDYAKEEYAEIPRLLAVLKTYFGPQVLGAEHWTGLTYQRIRAIREINKSVALSGVVDQQELDAVRELGGVTVWINRPSIKVRVGDTTITAADCDVVVENDGTFKEFYANIVESLEEWNEKHPKVSVEEEED